MNEDYSKYIDLPKLKLARAKKLEGEYCEYIALLEEVIEKLRMYPGDRMAPIDLCQTLIEEVNQLKNIQNFSSYETILKFIDEKNRICPRPDMWNKLWELLIDKKPRDAPDPPKPLILGAGILPEESKRERFLEHIKYAEKFGAINEVTRSY